MSRLRLSSLSSWLLSSTILALIPTFGARDMAAQSGFKFSAPQSYVVTTSPNQLGGLVASDFNGDGKPDLGAGFINPDINSPLQFGLLLNNGTVFSPVTLTQVNSNVGFQTTTWAVAGDFNGDGRMDLAVATGSFGFRGPGIFVLLGNGDGTFQPAVLYGAGMIGPIAVGDFNNDGIPDLFGLVPASGGGYSLGVLLGKGDGTFGSPVSSLTQPALGSVDYVVAGDYNRDGKLDVVVVVANSIELFFGNGDGSFTAGPVYQPISGSSGIVNGIAVGDVNGDGILDIVAGTYVINGGSTSLVVMLGNGDGTFQNPLTTPAEVSASPAALADFNLDGKADLVSLLNGNQVSFSMGNGDGTFQAPQHFSVNNIPRWGAAVADFDGNGAPDVAVVDATSISVIYNGFGVGLTAGSNPTSATVTAGQTASYTLSIGGGRMSGSATLACTGAPQGATCSVPGSISVNGTTASSVDVSVTTTTRTMAAMNSGGTMRLEGICAVVLFGLVLVPTGWRKRDSRALYLSALVASLLVISSCGGRTSGSTSNPHGTPAGTYTLTVTATLNSATQSVQLKLVVQ